MRIVALTVGLVVGLLAAGCQAPANVTVYSGRGESLIGPILDRFAEEKGITVEVRYAGTSEMAATLMEEGENTPADVFISQDAAALGALSEQGLLRPLPGDVLAKVEAPFASIKGDWVGLSGRARVVVYNTDQVTPEDLPRSLEEVADPRYKGKFGIAPANGSFQAHMAVYRALEGPEALSEWLGKVAANEPLIYPNNRTIVEATINGEVEWGLVNHYYLWRALQENPQAPARNFFMKDGPAAAFINLAGAAVLSDNPAALELVAYLLSEDAQRYFAEETYEYPLAGSVAPAVDLEPLDQIETPSLDFAQVSEVLEETLNLISESGLLP